MHSLDSANRYKMAHTFFKLGHEMLRNLLQLDCINSKSILQILDLRQEILGYIGHGSYEIALVSD